VLLRVETGSRLMRLRVQTGGGMMWLKVQTSSGLMRLRVQTGRRCGSGYRPVVDWCCSG